MKRKIPIEDLGAIAHLIFTIAQWFRPTPEGRYRRDLRRWRKSRKDFSEPIWRDVIAGDISPQLFEDWLNVWGARNPEPQPPKTKS